MSVVLDEIRGWVECEETWNLKLEMKTIESIKVETWNFCWTDLKSPVNFTWSVLYVHFFLVYSKKSHFWHHEIVHTCKFLFQPDKHGRLSWTHANEVGPGLSGQYTTCEYCHNGLKPIYVRRHHVTTIIPTINRWSIINRELYPFLSWCWPPAGALIASSNWYLTSSFRSDISLDLRAIILIFYIKI